MRPRTPEPHRMPAWRLACVALGALLLLAAAGLTGRNLWEQHRAQQASAELLDLARQSIRNGSSAEESEEADSGGPAASPDPWSGYDVDCVLSVPALGLELPVLADYSDALLRLAPCVYRYDPDSGRKVIAGHNYRVHFGRLGRLEAGDTVLCTALDGEQTEYRVTAVESISAQDAAALEAGEWDLTLLTCELDDRWRTLVRLESCAAS